LYELLKYKIILYDKDCVFALYSRPVVDYSGSHPAGFYIHTYIHTDTRTYIHTYIRMYIHTDTRTYIHTYLETLLVYVIFVCLSVRYKSYYNALQVQKPVDR